MNQHLKINTLGIVLLGDFNPTIIQPFWLASKGLIRDTDAENAVIEHILKQSVKFSLSWAKIEVTTSHFSITTDQESFFEPLRDLVLGVFKLLKETPITSLGVNHIYTFSLPDKKTFYEFGNKIAPLSNWDSFLNSPKVLQVEIIEETREDNYNGYFRVHIQPAAAELKLDNSIVFSINDHITLKKDETGQKGELLTYLRNEWNTSFAKANKIPKQLWDKIQF